MCLFKRIKDKDTRKIVFLGKVIFQYKKSHSKRFYINEYSKVQKQLEYMKTYCDIKHMKPAKGKLRERQLALVNFAQNFFEEIKELNIKPFLVCGNLLGHIRHKGFIPWDDDLDFGLFREDYEKLIKYCNKHYNVCYYDGNLSDYNEEKIKQRIENRCKNYAGDYVLDIFADQLQLSKGTSSKDWLFIDFWCFDFFNESYSFAEHAEYLKKLKTKQLKINKISEIAKFLRNEAKNNPNIVRDSSKVYFSPDCRLSYSYQNNEFIDRSIILPLRKVLYEGAYFYIPNKPKEYIVYEFKDYMNFPNDIGFGHHSFEKD